MEKKFNGDGKLPKPDEDASKHPGKEGSDEAA